MFSKLALSFLFLLSYAAGWISVAYFGSILRKKAVYGDTISRCVGDDRPTDGIEAIRAEKKRGFKLERRWSTKETASKGDLR